MSDRDRSSRRAVLVDLDGVVTDTARVHAAAWKAVFDGYLEERCQRGETHVPFDAGRDYLTYVDGKPRYDGVRSFLASRGIELPAGTPADDPRQETMCGLGNRKDAHFTRLLEAQGVDVVAPTLESLRALRARGAALGLVTSSRHGREIVDRAGLRGLFDVLVDGVVSAARRLRGKPHPDTFLEAARMMGVEPSRAVVIEDSASGVEAGRAGGFGLVVGVDRGGNRAALDRAGADIVVESLTSLSTDDLLGRAPGDLPSALDDIGWFTGQLRARRLALFLDYDGTLTPIVARPELARLPSATRQVLGRLARLADVALVSGRAVDDLYPLVALDGIVYAGNHGFEIRRPPEPELLHEVGAEYLPLLAAMREVLADGVNAVPGAWIEDKTYSLSIHYRQAPDDRVTELETAIDRQLARTPRLRKHHGKKVFEIRPRLEWDKGRAVLMLLDLLAPGAGGVLPVYIGDDVTDEDAFRALAERGVGILVAEEPRPTAAKYRLGDPSEVVGFLERLVTHLEGAVE